MCFCLAQDKRLINHLDLIASLPSRLDSIRYVVPTWLSRPISDVLNAGVSERLAPP